MEITDEAPLASIDYEGFNSEAEAIGSVILGEYSRGLSLMAALEISIERVEMTLEDLGAFMLGFMNSKLAPSVEETMAYYDAGCMVRSHMYDTAETDYDEEVPYVMPRDEYEEDEDFEW